MFFDLVVVRQLARSFANQSGIIANLDSFGNLSKFGDNMCKFGYFQGKHSPEKKTRISAPSFFIECFQISLRNLHTKFYEIWLTESKGITFLPLWSPNQSRILSKNSNYCCSRQILLFSAIFCTNWAKNQYLIYGCKCQDV